MGSPWSDNPDGVDAAGRPDTLNGPVKLGWVSLYHPLVCALLIQPQYSTAGCQRRMINRAAANPLGRRRLLSVAVSGRAAG